MATREQYERRAAFAEWFTALGLDPKLIPLDAAWSLFRPAAGSPATVTVEVFATDDTGQRIVRQDNGMFDYVRGQRTVPLTVDPPDVPRPSTPGEEVAAVARAVTAMVRDLSAALAPVLAEMARQCIALHKALDDAGLLDPPRTQRGPKADIRIYDEVPRHSDRPAWQTPYGPPPGRRRT